MMIHMELASNKEMAHMELASLQRGGNRTDSIHCAHGDSKFYTLATVKVGIAGQDKDVTGSHFRQFAGPWFS